MILVIYEKIFLICHHVLHGKSLIGRMESVIGYAYFLVRKKMMRKVQIRSEEEELIISD